MPQMSGRILYVNDAKPGQRNGSIKLDNNERINVPSHLLYQFQRGQEVTIDYRDRAGSDGRWWKDLDVPRAAAPPAPQGGYGPTPPQVSRPAGPRPPAPPPPTPQRPPPPVNPRQASDYNTGKQIAVTGITQRAVQSGMAPGQIPTIMKMVATAYDEIFNPQPKVTAPVYQDRGQPAGPRDDVPFDDSVEDMGYDDDPNRPPF